MRKPARPLKVVRAIHSPDVPLLPLKGKWLAEAGFVVGSRVEVRVGLGQLTVVLVEPGDREPRLPGLDD